MTLLYGAQAGLLDSPFRRCPAWAGGGPGDSVDVEVYQNWLAPAPDSTAAGAVGGGLAAAPPLISFGGPAGARFAQSAAA